MAREQKERFSISLSMKAVNWLDNLCEKKVFSSRTHGIEFFIEQFVDMPLDKIIKMVWNKNTESITLSEAEMEKIENATEKFKFQTKEETVMYAVRRLQEDSKK